MFLLLLRMQLYARIRRGSFNFPDGSFGWDARVFQTTKLHLDDRLDAVDWGEIQKRLIRGVMRKDAAARPWGGGFGWGPRFWEFSWNFGSVTVVYWHQKPMKVWLRSECQLNRYVFSLSENCKHLSLLTLVHQTNNGPISIFTPPKTNMETQNDALEKVAPLKYGHFCYLC